MLNFSEEVTKTWINKKGVLLKHKPSPSRFSFFVCFVLVLSLGIGVLLGFIIASFAAQENYSSVYADLIQELEDTKAYMAKERKEFEFLKRAQEEQIRSVKQIIEANLNMRPSKVINQVHEQAIFSVFGHAVDLLQKNDKTGACRELYNIVSLSGYEGEWKSKATFLLDKNCK